VLQGTVLVEGTYKELQSHGVDFAKLLGSSDETAVESTGDNRCDGSNGFGRLHGSTESISSLADESKTNGTLSQPREDAECRSFGRVAKNVYASYLSATGSTYKLSFCLLMYIVTQVLITGSDYWISFW